MIHIVTKSTCPYCSAAKDFLESIWKQYSEIEISHDPDTYQMYKDISGMRTVPQIFNGETTKEKLIGWYDEMMSLYREWKIFT